MDTQTLKIVLTAAVLLVVFGVVPIVMALLRHQQEMAELFAKNNAAYNELAARLESIERKLDALPEGGALQNLYVSQPSEVTAEVNQQG